MKKCVNCQLVFHSDERDHCFYCGSVLVATSAEEISASETEVKTISAKGPAMEHIAGSFFRTKSFSFLYSLNRNVLKTGRGFKRFLIYPIDFTFFIKIPWIAIDLLDSIIFRLIYTGFCEQCGWKYKKITLEGGHDPTECEYNKEYSAILNDILSGEIIRVETKYEKAALEKIKQGKRSAYHDLCARKKGFESFLDGVSILISLGLIIFIVVRLAMPIFGKIYDF